MEMAQSLLEFNKDWGNRGLIPHNLQKCIETDLIVTNKTSNDIHKCWVKLINKTIYKIWKNRCDHIEEETNKELETVWNKNSPPPPSLLKIAPRKATKKNSNEK